MPRLKMLLEKIIQIKIIKFLYHCWGRMESSMLFNIALNLPPLFPFLDKAAKKVSETYEP